MDILGPANFTVIERLSSLEVKLYCHDPAGATELVLYREVPLYIPFISLSWLESPALLLLFVNTVHSVIDDEIQHGISSERIMLG